MAENGNGTKTEHEKRTDRKAAAKKARETRLLRGVKVPAGVLGGATLYVEGEVHTEHKAEHSEEQGQEAPTEETAEAGSDETK